MQRFPVEEKDDELQIQFSPDGTRLLRLSDLRHIDIFDLESGNKSYAFSLPEGRLTTIEFSPDSSELVWANTNNDIIVTPISLFDDDDIVGFFQDLGMFGLTDEERQNLGI